MSCLRIIEIVITIMRSVLSIVIIIATRFLNRGEIHALAKMKQKGVKNALANCSIIIEYCFASAVRESTVQ
jgi:hypothetical protein